MRCCIVVFLLILIIPFSSAGQKFLYKESKQPFFKSGEWVMDISEIKIYDDDLLVGRIKFQKNKSALDTIESKVSMPGINFVFDKDNTVSEVGNGVIDFYSTKFREKYTREFYYFVSSNDQIDYLTFVIDIEERKDFVSLPFTIKKIAKSKKDFEIQLFDTRKQFSDFRLVRVH